MSEVMPNGWTTATIGEISNVKRGASPRPIQDPIWWGGKVGWVRISDVTASRKYLTETTQYLSDAGVKKSVQIKKGEVILSICATIGRPIIVKVDACIHDGFVWFDKLREDIDREFWYYFLSSKEEFLSSQRQSGTQGNLNTGIVSDLICSIPPFKEQQKIASILTAVDEVIESTQAQINKLKDLKTGMMQELLTKGIGHAEFKDSPVGRIPKAWEVRTIESVLDRVIDYRGKSPPKSACGVPLITAKNIRNGFIDEEPREFIFEEEYDAWMVRGIPRDGDIFITTEAPLGNVAKVPNYRFAVGQRVLTLSPAKKELIPDFLLFIMQSERFRNELEMQSTGSTVAGIKQSTFRQILIPVPSIDEQIEVSKHLAVVNDRIEALEKKYRHQASLKKGLMQDLLTGKVRVA